MQSKLNYLNLGCGTNFNSDWINIDIVSTGEGVIAHDITKGIPIPDCTCDVVYHSHLIEHIRQKDVMHFMKESYRVLKKGGIIRIATPNLEQICKIYLDKLYKSLDGDIKSSYDYKWILIEMYDQTVREKSGGEMLTYLSQNPIPNEDFVYERIGEEGRNLVKILRNPLKTILSANYIWQNWLVLFRKLLIRLYKIFERTVSFFILRRDAYKALYIGRCRLSGEIPHWMYDRYSLTVLLKSVGFDHVTIQSARNSKIKDWSSFNLDTTIEGNVRKPDSLFIEAVKI